MSSWDDEHTAGLCIYLFLFLIVVGAAYHSYVNLHRAAPQKSTDIFFGCMIAFSALRVLWMILRVETSNKYYSFITNRLAFSFFFTAFTNVVFFWAEMYQNMSRPQLVGFERRMKVFLSTNALLWLFQLVFVVVLFARRVPPDTEGDYAYDANIIVIAAITLLIAAVFMFYGSMISYRYYASARSVHSANTRFNVLAKITGTAVMFCVFFSVRVYVFSYRPVTGHYLPETLFNLWGYWVPEVLPTLWEVYLLLVQRSRSHQSRSASDEDEHSPAPNEYGAYGDRDEWSDGNPNFSGHDGTPLSPSPPRHDDFGAPSFSGHYEDEAVYGAYHPPGADQDAHYTNFDLSSRNPIHAGLYGVEQDATRQASVQ